MEHNPIIVARVLSYLPIAEIVRAQRVCRVWYDVVHSIPLLLGAWARCDPMGHDLYRMGLVLSRNDMDTGGEVDSPAATLADPEGCRLRRLERKERERVVGLLDHIAVRFYAKEQVQRTARFIRISAHGLCHVAPSFDFLHRTRWRDLVAPFAFMAPDIVASQLVSMVSGANLDVARKVARFNMPEAYFETFKIHFDIGVLLLGLLPIAQTLVEGFGSLPITETDATAMHWFLYGRVSNEECDEEEERDEKFDMFTWLLDDARAQNNLHRPFCEPKPGRKRDYEERRAMHYWHARGTDIFNLWDCWDIDTTQFAEVYTKTPAEIALRFPEIPLRQFTMLYDAQPAAISPMMESWYESVANYVSYMQNWPKFHHLFARGFYPSPPAAAKKILDAIAFNCSASLYFGNSTYDTPEECLEFYAHIVSIVSESDKQAHLHQVASNDWDDHAETIMSRALVFAAIRDPIFRRCLLTTRICTTTRFRGQHVPGPFLLHRIIAIDIDQGPEDCDRYLRYLPGLRAFQLSLDPQTNISYAELLRRDCKPHQRELVEHKLSQWLSGV